MPDTPLNRFAAVQKSRSVISSEDADDSELLFPMYTVSLDVLLQMKKVRRHEELLDAGVLIKYRSSLGRAMFISHQWLSDDHPDPDGEQLEVLQAAIGNILTGKSSVHVPVITEMTLGRVPTPTAADLRAQPLHIWYDYFSCPQGGDLMAKSRRQAAIDSIVSYISRCEYFVILCPALAHAQQQSMLGEHTWAERGWCRTERLARELAARGDGFAFVIQSSTHQHLVLNGVRHLDAPGSGQFTVASDRTKIGRVILQMVWKKLLYLLEQGDLHNYRFLLNTQARCCFRNLNTAPIESLVPAFVPRADPCTEPKAFIVEHFLHENGFRTLRERDHAGWTPLCYAAMSGRPGLVEALLECKANCNDKIAKPKLELGFPKHMNVLSLATHFGNIEPLKALLSARASVGARASIRSIALHWACLSDNVEAFRILRAAGSDVRAAMLPGLDSFGVACAGGSCHILQEFIAQEPRVSLRHCLHYALIVDGASKPALATLIEARADINEQLRLTQVPWRMVFAIYGLKHRVSPSGLTTLAYHHHGATPVMGILNHWLLTLLAGIAT
ncbi:Kidins220 [Symbiodinium natans]|uniref:Kidins220 protein n=1 Tax=Symbiodinium natans TaxID=878477 RepID=A0A812PWV4_9DINO|nr:Kidins220 [Symbiodinium natans]